MRAPADKSGRSIDAIVADIVRVDGVGKAREPMIRLLADGLLKLKPYPPLDGWRADNTKFATAWREWIEQGDALLKAVPENFNVHALFVPEIISLNETAEQTEARYAQAEICHEYLVTILAALHRRCGWIIEHQFGEHRSAGFQQERCAIAAGELMQCCGLPLAWSSSTSAYRRVATLLFEATTGTFGRDMERACETMARKV